MNSLFKQTQRFFSNRDYLSQTSSSRKLNISLYLLMEWLGYIKSIRLRNEQMHLLGMELRKNLDNNGAECNSFHSFESFKEHAFLTKI